MSAEDAGGQSCTRMKCQHECDFKATVPYIHDFFQSATYQGSFCDVIIRMLSSWKLLAPTSSLQTMMACFARAV